LASKNVNYSTLETSEAAMLDSSEGFWRGTTKPLRITSVGFVVAVVGAGLGLAVNNGQPTTLFLFAYGVTACGIAIGGIGVVWGMANVFRGKR
jgi:hypothetical protein